MTDDNFDDLEDDLEEMTFVQMDTQKIKDKIPTFTSKKLCEMIVCDRYFGCYREIGLACMEELATRRIAGDEFDFESYIEKALAELPPLDFSIPDLRNVLQGLLAKKGTK
jgi:hypothetical protein